MKGIPDSCEKDDTLEGEAACGARVLINPQTCSVKYKGEIIHFCGEDCRQQFTEDPLNSCLASRLLSDK